MKKLVFLHGAGSDYMAYHDTMEAFSRLVDAELISFNAPFRHPTKENKFIWFNKVEQNGRRDAVYEDYMFSMQYIKNKLYEISDNLKEIILIGHSQGGGMAAHVGLELNLNTAICICADLPYNVTYKKQSETPICWFEAGCDGYIDANRKASYKMLEKIGANLHYQILPQSTHCKFSDELLPVLKRYFKKT